MVVSRALLLLGAALVIGGVSAASAADLGGMKDEPVYAPATPSLRPSVYFRLDGGYSEYDEPTITENGVYTLTESEIGGAGFIGGGVGVSLGGGFRGDLTYDHLFESDVSANLPDYQLDLPGTRAFGFSSDVFLANLYYDFNWGGRFTPYVGVGLGFARNKTSAGTVTDPCGCVIGEIESGSSTDVAAAAMAGFAFKIRGGQETIQGSFKDAPMVVDSGRGLFLDVGYRFLYLSEVSTGQINATYNNQPVSEDPTVEDIHAHQIRAGLRYQLN